MTQINETLLTPKQLCEILQISMRTLSRHLKEKKIPYLRVGGLLRFKEQSIMKFLVEEESRTSQNRQTGNTPVLQSRQEVLAVVDSWTRYKIQLGGFLEKMSRLGILTQSDLKSGKGRLDDVTELLAGLKSQTVQITGRL